MTEQERVVASLRALFPEAAVVDRRANPSHGYRAVHIIARISEKLIEIQVRSPLQRLWAEFSEKLSDIIDPSIKYGGGEEQMRQMLAQISGFVAEIEVVERIMASLPKRDLSNLSKQQTMTLQDAQRRTDQYKAYFINLLNEMVSRLEYQKGQTK